MHLITLGSRQIEVRREEHRYTLDRKAVYASVELPDAFRAKVTKDGHETEIWVHAFDPETQTAVLRINGKKINVKLTTAAEIYLKKIGIELSSLNKVSELKAPMPGLIKRVEVVPGQSVSAGDPLLVLEAMKMENVLKASAAGTVKTVEIAAGTAVEKNAVLIRFE